MNRYLRECGFILIHLILICKGVQAFILAEMKAQEAVLAAGSAYNVVWKIGK